MTKEEQIALDEWRNAVASRSAKRPNDTHANFRVRQYKAYRRLVRDDVRPPVVDRENCVFQNAVTPDDIDEGVAVIKAYGDERFAEGERAGIERAIDWVLANGSFIMPEAFKAKMTEGLLGEPK